MKSIAAFALPATPLVQAKYSSTSAQKRITVGKPAALTMNQGIRFSRIAQKPIYRTKHVMMSSNQDSSKISSAKPTVENMNMMKGIAEDCLE